MPPRASSKAPPKSMMSTRGANAPSRPPRTAHPPRAPLHLPAGYYSRFLPLQRAASNRSRPLQAHLRRWISGQLQARGCQARLARRASPAASSAATTARGGSRRRRSRTPRTSGADGAANIPPIPRPRQKPGHRGAHELDFSRAVS